MRRGFTLLELLTAVGIMAMLGVAASNGYRSLSKGMRERSAVAAASAALRAARERALVDRVRTVVFCYNRLIRKANPSADENAVAVGVITAIRSAGRITGLSGDLMYDEFADLDRTYEGLNEEAECKTHKGLRLFYMPRVSTGQMQYSVVSDAVYRDDTMKAYLPSEGVEPAEPNLTVAAFVNLHRSKNEPSWRVGDEYALEFLDIELPQGFLFGSGQIPTELGVPKLVDVFTFDPDDAPNRNVEIYFAVPGSSGNLEIKNKVGTAKSDNDNV